MNNSIKLSPLDTAEASAAFTKFCGNIDSTANRLRFELANLGFEVKAIYDEKRVTAYVDGKRVALFKLSCGRLLSATLSSRYDDLFEKAMRLAGVK